MSLINQLNIDENNIAFLSTYGTSYELSESGVEIVNLLKQHKSIEEIVEVLANEYDEDKNIIYIDVNDFIAKLKIYGLY